MLNSPKRPDRRWGPHSLLFNGYEDYLLWGKAIGAQRFSSTQTIAEKKKVWSNTSAFSIRLQAVDKENFLFLNPW
jgi:hypothetical protein